MSSQCQAQPCDCPLQSRTVKQNTVCNSAQAETQHIRLESASLSWRILQQQPPVNRVCPASVRIEPHKTCSRGKCCPVCLTDGKQLLGTQPTWRHTAPISFECPAWQKTFQSTMPLANRRGPADWTMAA
eukprot:1149775-Pelagomonas_calceolata.AAC.8